ncbi:MepB family protein [Owenweeksia hongkongensis]|uniref:MepB family protein n=1 Tax=Owenweeksia hongkongensis TaxID=253245 RepID=UPI003A93B4EE
MLNVLFNKSSFEVSAFVNEPESKEYDSCRFKLNGQSIVYRSAKITPKKAGQFVTFWKRNIEGITEPLHENDPFDFYIINVASETKRGQFIVPKSILIEKGIVATHAKDGKRGFRVYPPWDTPTSKQAEKTQKWQIEYFVEISNRTDFKLAKELLGLE